MNRYWIVGTENGILLQEDTELTTNVDNAKTFDKIGDAMREAVRLNELKLNLNMFKVIPL